MDIDFAQRPTTQSSFANDWMGNASDFSFFSTPGLSEKYPLQSTTVFNEDNQKTLNRYAPSTGLWLASHVIPQDKTIQLEEYKGFKIVEWGEIAVSYNKEGAFFLYNFKFLCLNRQAHNDFYLDPYLTVCFELELEGSGDSKRAALADLYQLLDVYFNRTREVYEIQSDYAEVITANITRQNSWKESFACAYKCVQKLDKLNFDYRYQIN